MKHVSELDLIRLASGEPVRRPDDVAAHLASCTDCAAALARQREVHAALDAWDVGPNVDMWPAIEQALDRRATLRLPWAMLAGLGRAAAVLVISVGLGFGAGRLAGVGRSIAPAQITADAALDAIGFGLIEDPSSTGLLNDILPAPDAEGTQ